MGHMVSNTDPIERAKRRFLEVQEIMTRAAQVRQEYYDLEAFLAQAHRLFPDAFEEWPPPGMSGAPETTPAALEVKVGDSSQLTDSVSVQLRKPVGQLRTSDFAEWVLKVHGPLHIDEILRRMHEEGWSGNKDGAKAKKTLFNILSAQKERFKNTGKNMWELKEKGR